MSGVFDGTGVLILLFRIADLCICGVLCVFVGKRYEIAPIRDFRLVCTSYGAAVSIE